MTTYDVWVRVNSDTSGSRMVRADTVEQVRWDRKTPQHLILTLNNGDEVRQDVPPGVPREGPDLAEHLVRAMVRAAERPGGQTLVLEVDENTGDVGWVRTPLADKPWKG